MKFSDYRITPELKDNLSEAGFKRPTDIQYKCISHILNGEDVLAIAQTGTGKTAAFAIPLLHLIHQQKKKARRKDGIKCLIMVPTHELASQIQEVFKTLSKNTLVNTYALFGGVAQDPQIRQLEKGVDILIATPGRLFDLASQGHLRLHRVERLVLDEADHMLDLGFIKDIEDLIQKLPKRRQTLFFSATIDDKIKRLAYALVRNAIRIQISPKDPVAKNINHSVAFVEMDDKRFFLERLIFENPETKILVFVRTRVRAERVHKAMERINIETLVIHGAKEQQQRDKVMEVYRAGKVKILIATDVSARGIDIPDVDFVVNYDLPDQPENYVHRVGRTGRGKNKGNAVAFCSERERTLLQKIEDYTGNKVKVLEITQEDYSETLDFTEDITDNWMNLIEKANLEEFDTKRKKKNRSK